MTYKSTSFCRISSLLISFMLLLQICNSQTNFKEVDEWLNLHLTQLGGRAVLVIYKDGKIIYSNAQNNLTQRQKMIAKFIANRQGENADDLTQDYDVNSKIRFASCSKWLSAALVMSFVDEGKLSLEDSIGKYLPPMTTNGKGYIKIWQCLSHLTGISSIGIKEGIQKFQEFNNMQDAMEYYAQQPLEGMPGKTFHYSNVGLQICAAILEKITGKNFQTLFVERIAKPCNMLHTDFGTKKLALAAGGAFSTATDYNNFLQMILNKGVFNGKQVLSKWAITEMQKNRIDSTVKIMGSPEEAGSWGYGFGEWVMDENAISSPGLFGTFPWVNKKLNYCADLVTYNLNNKGRHQMYTDLRKIVDDKLK